MYVVVSNNGTSTYNLSYIVCFRHFLLVSVCYISYGGFQIKFIKLVADIVYARLKKGKVGSLRKLSQFYITEVSVLCTETLSSSFHLYGCGKPPQPYR